MTIPFKNIPQNLRTPLFYAEVDASQANTAQASQRALIVGQIASGGTGVADTPVLCQGIADAKAQGGAGSILALMAAAYIGADPYGEVWLGPLADNGAGVAATGSVLFAGPATAAGTINLYVAGGRVQIPVLSGATAASLATALAAAIAANSDLPVTAAVDGANTAKVNLTAKNAGECGNDIDLRMNYRNAAGGEATPAGITVTLTAMAGGATNPVLTNLLTNLHDKPFDFIVSPYTDSTSLAAFTALLNDQTGRWSWQVQIYGHVFTAKRASYAGLATFGVTQNDPHSTALGVYDSPTPAFVWAAAVAGAAAASLRADPALPLQTVTIPGVLPPPLTSRFTLSQRNALLYDGISTFTVQQGGVVAIENLITTYQKNAFGQPDNSLLEVETLFTIAAVLRRLAAVITSKFARVKLASDGARIAPGSAIVTPKVVRGALIAEYRAMESDGLVQDAAVFAANIVVQRNSTNPNRLDVLWPGTLIGQLRQLALLLQFRLQ